MDENSGNADQNQGGNLLQALMAAERDLHEPSEFSADSEERDKLHRHAPEEMNKNHRPALARPLPQERCQRHRPSYASVRCCLRRRCALRSSGGRMLCAYSPGHWGVNA